MIGDTHSSFTRPPNRKILGTRIDAIDFSDVRQLVESSISQGESYYVCIANVHVVMEAHDLPSYQKAINSADLVTPDGMPLVWELKKRGFPNQTRVSGPDLMPWLLEIASKEGWPVGFYGATDETLAKVVERAKKEFPALSIAYVVAPPFRALTDEEEAEVAANLIASGVRLLFVAIGCPKQELWMARMDGKVPAVMFGVGAAIDFYSGNKSRAPEALQRLGLEWIHRLVSEPKRLWKRYFKHNPRFLWMCMIERLKKQGTTDAAPSNG